ncbi:MAG: hypothetical protein HQL71_09750 [Magnetococcales bacterium]|nr:hypothetical protein [Magnetococcales bacterium]
MEGDPTPGAYCNNLSRIAAVGSTGMLDLGDKTASTSDGKHYSDLILGSGYWGQQNKLPIGYISALGMGLDCDPQKTWGVVGLLHLFQKTNKLLFFSPQRVGLTREEKEKLILGLKDEFAHHGFTLFWSDKWAAAVVSLDRKISVTSTPLEVLEGQSFFDCLPSGDGASTIISLVTTGQMLLARDEVNKQREKNNLLPLNTPWIWGVDQGNKRVADRYPKTVNGGLWSSDVLVAGLGCLAGLQTACIDENTGMDSKTIEQVADVGLQKDAIIHFKTPAQLARLGMLPERQARLEQIDKQFLNPLFAQIAKAGGKITVTTSAKLDKEGKSVASSVPWVTAQGDSLLRKKRFWNRQSLDSGAVMSLDKFSCEWV